MLLVNCLVLCLMRLHVYVCDLLCVCVCMFVLIVLINCFVTYICFVTCNGCVCGHEVCRYVFILGVRGGCELCLCVHWVNSVCYFLFSIGLI